MLLAVAPWTVWWERNFFASLVPDLSSWMGHVAVRVVVSAIGALTMLTGLADLRTLRREPARPGRTSTAPAPRDS